MTDATDDRLRTAVGRSWFGRIRRRLRIPLATAMSTSVLGQFSDTVATLVTSAAAQSACVRWLTSEPTDEPVVIDLERTRTIGPVVRLVQRTTPTISRSYRASTLQTVVQWGRQVSEPIQSAVCQSTTWQVFERLLKPPEYPGRDS